MTIQVTNNDPVAVQAEKPVGESVVPSLPAADQAAEQKEESPESDTEETEAKEEKDAKDEGESDDESESEASEKDEKPKKKSGAQRRKERAERAEAEAARARAEAEHWKTMALKGAGDSKTDAPKAETAKTEAAGKPSPDSFETYAEYTEALTDWKIEQRDKAAKEQAAKSKFEAEQADVLKAHSARVKAFTEKTPDFLDVLEDVSHIPVSPTVERELLSSENGPELIYALAQDPAEFERINKLGPIAAARELGRLEVKLSSKATDPKPEPKKLTNAPKPLAPVGAGKGAVAKTIDDPNLSQREYETIRRKQLAARKAW
jgi:hypothetical protein